MQNKLKILIIGAGGGREHALGWKIAQSGRAGELFFARGNAGFCKRGKNRYYFGSIR
ncbi:MAG: Phosphoribosylamine-glycine ligase [Parcubacteria group bacterium GW2011_GWF1_40_5]|nr:MAG: Phosphoribosylamine-glycine ligase [Parcubacteria group bacterium GW2011_GWF1_40_5]